MRQLQSRHILLFRILRDHCLFLTRKQIERVLTLPTNSTNKELLWLLSEKYLGRRYRADTFGHFQTPLYYLGTLGWHIVGNPMDDYKEYRLQIQRRAEHQMDHRLSIYDVFLKFILEGEVKRIIDSEDRLWQESINFGNIPDGWIQLNNDGAFVEVDRDTERPIVLKKKVEKYVNFKESGGYQDLFPECAFTIIGKGNRERVLFFSPRALNWVKEYVSRRKDHGEALFVVGRQGRPMRFGAAITRFRRFRKMIGFPKPVTAHMFRHTVATTLLFNGCPIGHIKDILGHDRLITTCNFYLGADKRAAKKAHGKYLDYEEVMSGQ